MTPWFVQSLPVIIILSLQWLVGVTQGLASTPVDNATTEQRKILQAVRLEHAAEVERGFSLFGEQAVDNDSSPTIQSFTDQDFVVRAVGSGRAGPDEASLGHGDHIFQTTRPIVSDAECEALIQEANAVITQRLESESTLDPAGTATPTNSQLGEAPVSSLPQARQWLRKALHERFFPLLESRFGVKAADLTLHDALIIGYGYFGGGSNSQPVHRDSSLLSLNVALSPLADYQGGGTFFEGLSPESSTVYNERGHVLCHAGGNAHAGRGIAQGHRWVLVLFCIAKEQPQLARRCHARGMAERSQGLLNEAVLTFQAGLSQAPRDHLLWTSLGGVYMEQKRETAARGCLARAASNYPNCIKAHLSLGRTLLAQRKPRAALRRFDAILDWLQDRDLKDGVWEPYRALGYDARVYGAQAALLASREAKRRGVEDFDWRRHTQQAMERSKISLLAAPNDPRIPQMLDFAKELLLY